MTSSRHSLILTYLHLSVGYPDIFDDDDKVVLDKVVNPETFKNDISII